ncbi:MAG: sensor domain-containing diguanylate cyclase [Bacillota bacterium]|nr:hypothetical protein [Bacillota bacterium]
MRQDDEMQKSRGISDLQKTIEDLRQDKEKLQKSEELYRFLAENSIDAIWWLDDQFCFVYVSPAVKGILGYQVEDIVGKHLFSILTEESIKIVTQGYNKRKALQESGQKWESSTYTVETIHKDGHHIWAEVTVNPIFGPDNRLIGYNGITRDISERRRKEEIIRQYAFRDSLTNLPNRRSFEDVLGRIEAQHRKSEKPFAVMFLDVDGLKKVNDIYGHTAGDTLLQTVAGRLSRMTRKQDFVARFAGDEFMVILPGIGDARAVQAIATRLIESFHQTIVIGANEVKIAVSIGVSFFPQDAGDVNILVECADQAMYEAKKTKGSYYVCYEQLRQGIGQEWRNML